MGPVICYWEPLLMGEAVIPVHRMMFLQLIEAASASFFIGDMLAWLKVIGVLGAWIVTFIVSAPCHRKLAKDGMQTQVVERLISTNWLRTFFWSFVFIISWLQY